MKQLVELFKKYNFFNQKLDRFSKKVEFKNKITDFRKELELTGINEATLKDRISDILNLFYDSQQKNIGQVDLELKESDKPRVFFEFKRPSNISEMVTVSDLNKKSMHELIVYFRENVNKGNNELKWLIITNGKEWFIFSVSYFYDNFVNNPYFQAIAHSSLFSDYFDNLTSQQKYERISFFIDKYRDKLELNNFYYFNFFTVEEEIAVKTLFCLLSPEFLFEKYNPNRGNVLNKNFYDELLYIMGLREIEEKGKKFIKPNNVKNTFFDQIFEIIADKGEFKELALDERRLRELALELLIVWFNRILFLKLFEAKLKDFNDNSLAYSFMSSKFIEDFSKLNYLFFNVLAKPVKERKDKEKFINIPYLNSSLFERHWLEKYINISELINEEVDYYSKTILRDTDGNRKKGKTTLLTYLFDFLDAYDFGAESVDSSKDLISPAVLGLVFEKINGYKDGSYYTPTEITDYMAKESIELYILNKYNKLKNTGFQTFTQLFNSIINGYGDIGLFKEIVNKIKICDPAVGSGHFLVSALNILLLIKWRLGLFKNNIKLKQKFDIDYLDGDLVFKDRYSNLPFKYRKDDEISQLFQETLFKEKKYIIENNLFGVDINPKSVEIARLRLWIELLKNAYYTKESNFKEMQTLPNIDINIKIADSLLSEIIINESTPLFSTFDFQLYKSKWQEYQNSHSVDERNRIRKEIQQMKDKITGIDNFSDFVWAIDFPQTIEENKFSGFDIIIGNPPYGVFYPEEINKKIIIKKYVCCGSSGKKGTLDSFALFIERGVNLLKKEGVLTFIVPLSFTSGDSMIALHESLEKNCSLIKTVSFAVRPQQIFESAVVDVSILTLLKTLMSVEEIYSSKLYRKSKEKSLNKILSEIETVNVKDFKLRGRYPKISSQIEIDILNKILKQKCRIKDLLCDDGDKVYYRTSGGRYFKIFTNYSTGSTKENIIYILPGLGNLVGCILSSNLFFWWYQIYSNNHDLKVYEIEQFPIPLSKIDTNILDKIENIYHQYLQEIENNAIIHQTTSYKKVTTFKEYKIKKSKKFIDSIDDLVGPLYELSPLEIDFIKNYEIEFRISDD